MAPRFAEHIPLDGYDAGPVPDWQMAPVGFTKVVRLIGGAGLDVSVTPSGFATVAEAFGPVPKPMRLFHITGVKKGTAFLEAKDAGGTVRSRLELSVKDKKPVKVTFNFVFDSAGHKTVRAHSSVDGWVSTMNSIFLPQVNVEIIKHNVRNVSVGADLGRVVRFSSHLPKVAAAQHEWDDVIAKRDGTADFNFFFVWQYEQDASPLSDNTQAGTMAGDCLFQDTGMKDVAENLAHETGHFLGASDTYASHKRQTLMYGYTDVRGRKILKVEANLMNP